MVGDLRVRKIHCETPRENLFFRRSLGVLFLALAVLCIFNLGTESALFGQSNESGKGVAPEATPWSPGNVKSFVLRGPNGESIPINYDESKADGYTLPDPLTMKDGRQVRTARAWYDEHRPQLLHLFEENVYGRTRARPDPYGIHYKVFNIDRHALGGAAFREQVMFYFRRDETGPRMDMVVYLPAHANHPVPLFLCLSFSGVNAIADDSGVQINEIWNNEEEDQSSGLAIAQCHFR